MKILLWMICLCVTVQVATKEKPRRPGAKDFNEMRHKIGRKFNDSTMNLLDYSDELEKIAKGLDCEAKHGSDYRVFLLPDIDVPGMKEITAEVFDNLDKQYLEEMLNSNTPNFLEMLFPQQKSIGCALKNCPTQMKLPNGVINDIDTSEICVMVPIGKDRSGAPPAPEPESDLPSENGDTKEDQTSNHDEELSDIGNIGIVSPGDPLPPSPETSTLPPSSSSSTISFFTIPLICLFFFIV